MCDTNDATTGPIATNNIVDESADGAAGSGVLREGGEEGAAYTNDALFMLHDGTDVREGHSRFARALAQNRWIFRDSNHTLTADPTRFVVAAFQAGTAPIMNPPYIGAHPRVVRAYPRSDPQGRYLLIAELAIPTPRKIVNHLPDPVRGWERDGRGDYRPSHEYDRVVAYVRLTLGVPIRPELLPAPGYDERGVPDLDIARRALRAVTNHASAVCASLIASLDDTTHPLL
jgi:hypothetical protein